MYLTKQDTFSLTSLLRLEGNGVTEKTYKTQKDSNKRCAVSR